jgi:hypothetical protein
MEANVNTPSPANVADAARAVLVSIPTALIKMLNIERIENKRILSWVFIMASHKEEKE